MKRFIVILGMLFVFTLFIFGEPNFERVLKGTLEGEELPGCYLGGVQMPRVSFADLDNDGDVDFVLGNYNCNLWYFKNDGNPNTFTWIISDPYFINTGYSSSSPSFVDIDNDNDYDLFICNSYPNIFYFRNDGTPDSFSYTLITNNYFTDLGSPITSNLIFPDIDDDNDFDCFISDEPMGNFIFFKNTGTANTASWVKEDSWYEFISIANGEKGRPVFVGRTSIRYMLCLDLPGRQSVSEYGKGVIKDGKARFRSYSGYAYKLTLTSCCG